MKNIIELMDEINRAFESEQWQKCISLCKIALPLTDLSEYDSWFDFRFKLSKCLILDSNSHSENIEESIEVLHDVLETLTKDDHPIRWAMVNLGLAYAYDERKKGDRQNNIEILIRYYENALSVFTFESHPEEWAATSAAIGFAYAIRDIGEIKDNVSKSIKYIASSLRYYTKADNPCQYWDKLKEIKRLKVILRDNMLWNRLLSENIESEEIENDLKGPTEKGCDKQWNEKSC